MRKQIAAFALTIPGIAVTLLHCGGTTQHTEPNVVLEFPTNHRETPTTCSMSRPPGTVDAGTMTADAGGPNQDCVIDSDCTKGKNGRCQSGGRISLKMCTYDACFVDSDCAANETCLCQSSGNACLPSNCRSDADCAGLGCSSTVDSTCGSYGGTRGFYCHTAHDECVNDSDCKEGGAGFCSYQPQVSHWVCGYTICAG